MIKMAYTNLEKILSVSLLATIIIAAAVALIYTRRISNVGKINIVGFQIYQDRALTTPLTSIDWGNVNPGDTLGVTAYLYNSNNTAITINFTITDWQPPGAAQYLMCDWNITTVTTIPAYQIQPCLIRLTISPLVTGIDTFSFTVTLTAKAT